MSVIICLYIVIPFLCIVGMRKADISVGLSKNTTVEIRGVSMLLIIFAHAVSQGDITLYTFFFSVSAILGVSICFFVSGYGLYMSYLNKNDYLKGFLLTKIPRILIPYLISYLLYIVIQFVEGDKPSILSVGKDFVLLEMGGLLLWYLKIQLLLYVFFYISFKFIKSEKIKIISLCFMTVIYYIVIKTCGFESYWYNTCLFFPLGIILGKRKDWLVSIIKRKITFIISFAILLLTFLFIFKFGRMNIDYIIDNVYMLSFLLFITCLFCRYNGSILLECIGKYSMEIYLIHILLLKYNLFGYFNSNSGISYMILLAVTILISIPVYYITNWIVKQISIYLREKNKCYIKE